MTTEMNGLAGELFGFERRIRSAPWVCPPLRCSVALPPEQPLNPHVLEHAATILLPCERFLFRYYAPPTS